MRASRGRLENLKRSVQRNRKQKQGVSSLCVLDDTFNLEAFISLVGYACVVRNSTKCLGTALKRQGVPPAGDTKLSQPSLERRQIVILTGARSRSGSACSILCH